MCSVLSFHLDLPLMKKKLLLDPQITKTSYFQKPTKLSRRGYRLSQKPQDTTSENGEKFRNNFFNLGISLRSLLFPPCPFYFTIFQEHFAIHINLHKSVHTLEFRINEQVAY